MNIRLIIFSGVITALLGSVLGLAMAKVGQKDFNQLRYQSQVYQDLYNEYYIFIGAGLGFTIGAGQECVRELKNKQDKEIENYQNSKKGINH